MGSGPRRDAQDGGSIFVQGGHTVVISDEAALLELDGGPQLVLSGERPVVLRGHHLIPRHGLHYGWRGRGAQVLIWMRRVEVSHVCREVLHAVRVWCPACLMHVNAVGYPGSSS